jgi:transposase
MSLATRLVHEGFRVSVIHPSQAHHFAKALLKRAKTDAIDAQTLAQLAMVLQPEPWMPPPQIYYELQQRLAQRDDLLNLRQQVRNQLHALAQHPEVIASVCTRMERFLVLFQSQIDEGEGEMAAALNQDSAWAAAAERLQSITGVGWVTAAWTLVTTLNLTTCDTVDALTAYAGLIGKYLSRLGPLDYVIIPKKGFETQLGTSSVPIPRRMRALGMTRQIRDGGL